MKTVESNCKYRLLILMIALFSILPAIASGFDIGTQFGISRLVPEEEQDSSTVTYTRLPSGSILDVWTVPTSLYAMFYPHKHIGIGPEFSYGAISVSYEDYGDEETESINTLHLGAKLALYLTDYKMSSPYILGRVSVTSYGGELDYIFSFDDSDTITSIGIGAGYQFVVKPAFILRLEGRLNRLTMEDENVMEYGLFISIGTRFGQ